MTNLVKRIELAGRDFYGKIPKEFLDNDVIAKMEFHIRDFSNLQEKRNKRFYTGTIKAHGHLWKLMIYPRGEAQSTTGVEYVSVYLYYACKKTETDPVLAKAIFRTKTINWELPKYEYSKKTQSLGWKDSFGKREDIIENDCDDAGTLTITVELQVATDKRSVWYPQLTSCDYTRLYKSVETSDVTVMAGTKEFQLHKCVLTDRARVLYELVRIEEESSPFKKNNCIVVRIDVDETVFEVLLQFVYSSEEPKLNDLDEETIKTILIAANRFGVTELKLYVESILIEKFLVPFKAAGLLLFADSYTCPLLKEKSMNAYFTDSTTFMASEGDWKKLQESPKLLTELLVYTNNGRKRYSSFVDDGNGTIEDADDFDVTSLREHLQKFGIDVDGSRTMLVERWKNHLRTNKNNEEDVDSN